MHEVPKTSFNMTAYVLEGSTKAEGACIIWSDSTAGPERDSVLWRVVEMLSRTPVVSNIFRSLKSVIDLVGDRILVGCVTSHQKSKMRGKRGPSALVRGRLWLV